MLEGFKAIVDRDTLKVVAMRMREIHMKLRNGKPLIQEEEKYLKHYLRGMEGLSIAFRDEKHRLQLIERWWRDAKLHDKRLEEEEAKAKK